MPAALSEEEGGQQSMNTAFQKRLRRMSKSIMERSIEFPEMGPVYSPVRKTTIATKIVKGIWDRYDKDDDSTIVVFLASSSVTCFSILWSWMIVQRTSLID